MELLKAQAAIAQLLAEYDTLVEYASTLSGGYAVHQAQEQAQLESAASAFVASAHVVARHFGIRLVLHEKQLAAKGE